jgi:cytoskeleton protein RodZ
MESIGEKLRLARERSNLTIEQVARETNVARRFLRALEEEDFETFPGETYAMGFLRNYAEFLGLDPDELISTYRNIKIQEQPLPMNELLDTRPRLPQPRLIIIAAAALLVLAGAGYLVYRAVAGRAGAPAGNSSIQKPATGAAADFVFKDEVRTQWFAQGDAISVPLAGATYRVLISAVGANLTLSIPGGTVEMGLGKDRYIDLDGDSKPDIRIVWNDADLAGSQKRVNLGLYKTTGQAAEAAMAAAGDTADSAVPGDIPATAGSPPIRTDAFKPINVAQSVQPALFAVSFTFKNDCLFRFLVDDKEREDRFFQRGEQFTIDTAKNRLTVWLSNAGAARMRIQGRDFEIGGLGEVATRTVAWRKDAASGGYVLEIAALY